MSQAVASRQSRCSGQCQPEELFSGSTRREEKEWQANRDDDNRQGSGRYGLVKQDAERQEGYAPNHRQT
jgi:hypothetical protein